MLNFFYVYWYCVGIVKTFPTIPEVVSEADPQRAKK